MGGKSSKMGYQQLINENNNSKNLFGKHANFNPNFSQAPPAALATKSINELAKNKRYMKVFNTTQSNQNNITKRIMNSARTIPGIAFSGKRVNVTPFVPKGGKRKSMRKTRRVRR
jgi:hypothetical protein